MKLTHTILLASLTIPLTLAFAVVADDVSFHPASATKVEKELHVEAELQLKDMSATMNGEPLPGEMLDQLGSQAILLSLGIEVTETFVATKDGAPTDLLRSYDKVTTTMEFGDETQEPESANELEGKTVRFLWDDDALEFKKSFHESSGDDSLLESLIDDMEVRALLPGKKVSADDTWEVAGEKLTALFFPGGVAGGVSDGGEGPDVDAMSEAMAEQFAEAFKEFRVRCTYKGSREVDGKQVGEITFTYDGKGSLDMGSVLEEVAGSLGPGAGEMDITADATLSLKGEGTLLWDLATGLLHAYEMRADVGLGFNLQLRTEQQGQQLEFGLTGELGGDVTWELTRE